MVTLFVLSIGCVAVVVVVSGCFFFDAVFARTLASLVACGCDSLGFWISSVFPTNRAALHGACVDRQTGNNQNQGRNERERFFRVMRARGSLGASCGSFGLYDSRETKSKKSNFTSRWKNLELSIKGVEMEIRNSGTE